MRSRGCYCLLLLIATARISAQGPENAEPGQFYVDYAALVRKELSLVDAGTPAPTRMTRLQLLRMPSGFYALPLNLVPEDDPLPKDPFAKVNDDLSFVQFAYGNHVPYLDLPKRGDPGGVEYYKIHSQVQIFDLGPTNVSLAVQALAPMGLQAGSVNSPTNLSPALACVHDFGGGAALHAFVGQEIAPSGRRRDQVQASLRCGLAVQHPLPFTSFNADQGVFVFVQALGQSRPDVLHTDVRATTWDVTPGLQYRLNNACWMSMGISRSQFMTCVWQY